MAHILLVSRVAGHLAAPITLDVWAHLFDHDLAQAARLFDLRGPASAVVAEADRQPAKERGAPPGAPL